MIAFEDSEMSEWLIQAIEEDPGQFLRALAEAAVLPVPGLPVFLINAFHRLQPLVRRHDSYSSQVRLRFADRL